MIYEDLRKLYDLLDKYQAGYLFLDRERTYERECTLITMHAIYHDMTIEKEASK